MPVTIKEGVCTIDGADYPAVGFGTWPYKDRVCQRAVESAIKSGYRIIDTATFYANFQPIGEALKGVKREEIYLISKVWPDDQRPDRLKADLEKTLRELNTPYLDAYLLHWPTSRLPIEETLGAMIELRDEGKICHIGLSNVTTNHLKRLEGLNIPITWVQVEMGPQFHDAALTKYCQERSIGVQAWEPLEGGKIGSDPDLIRIGKKHRKSPFQVALRWILQNRCLPLPGSQNPDHIQENFDIFNFTLTLEEMSLIDGKANQGKRKRVIPEYGFSFEDEFDYTLEQCWPTPFKRRNF